MKIHPIIIIALIVLALFSLVSIFHAYSFTHPVREEGWSFKPKNGMNLTIDEKGEALVFGIRPIRGSSAETPSEKKLAYEEVAFKSRDGLNISGWYIPARNSKGAVLLVHGYYKNKAAMLDYAQFLNENGYDTLSIDLRGSGQSEGEYVSMGHYERLDVLGAADYLKSRPDYNQKKLFGFGLSLGAAALVFAEDQEHSFDALILDSCFTNVHDNVARRFQKVYGLPKFPFATSLTFFGGLILNVDGFSISPENSLRRIHIPVLVIQSSEDDSVSVEDGERLFNHANDPKLFLLIAGANHAKGLEKDPQRYQKTVNEFLEVNRSHP